MTTKSKLAIVQPEMTNLPKIELSRKENPMPYFKDHPRIFNFLNSSQSVALFLAASLRGRPAIEGVAAQLNSRFGTVVESAGAHIAVGLQIKEIMDKNGWKVTDRCCKVRPGLGYRRGAVYSQKAGFGGL